MQDFRIHYREASASELKTTVVEAEDRADAIDLFLEQKPSIARTAIERVVLIPS